MAASFTKSDGRRRHCRLLTAYQSQVRVPVVVSFLVMVLLTTTPSSAKRLPFGGTAEVTESTPKDFLVLQHQDVVEAHLHTVSTLPHDAQRLLKLLLAGQPVAPHKSFLYQVITREHGPYFSVRASSPTSKEEDFQFSLKEYKVVKKPYLSLVVLDNRDTVADQVQNTVWDLKKAVKHDNLPGDENEANNNPGYPDQEMAESTLHGEHDHGKTKRSVRLPRSPVTGRGFLGIFPGLYGFGVDEVQDQTAFNVPIGYDASGSRVNAHAVSNQQQYQQEGQWNIGTPQNTHRNTLSEALYPLLQSTSLQTRSGRGNILQQTTAGDRELFHNGEYAHPALGGQDDLKNTFHENIRNYISQTDVPQKKALQNKKRDLSREHMTVGENLDTGAPQKSTLYRSAALERSNRYDGPILENGAMRTIVREEAQWDKIGRGHFDNQFRSVSQDNSANLHSQLNIPIGDPGLVLSILPLAGKSSTYDHIIGSEPSAEDVYGVTGSVDEGTFVLLTGDQQKFWLEGESGLVHGDVFSRPVDQSGLGPAVDPHMGIRIFKRSVAAEGLSEGGVPHLVKNVRGRGGSHTSGILSKRSPLSTGYVAGIGADADHHHHHDHVAAASTAHHHEPLPPAVILSSGHHHDDTAHHLVAKSETTVGGGAGGASSGRGPNQEDSGPGALVVLHPPHPVVAAHADDDTIHVIAAVPLAVAHHHELHHEEDHLLSKSTTLTLAQHDSDPHVLAKTTTVTTVTQHADAPLLVVHAPDSPVVLVHHPPASHSSTSTTTVHKPSVTHNLLRFPIGGFGVGVTFGGAGAGHGFYAAG